MPEDTATFRIFVGSPTDVPEARKRAFDVIDRLDKDGLLPDGYAVKAIGWDRTSYPNPTWRSPQKAIDEGIPRPSECDIAVFILWKRIGTQLNEEDYPKETHPRELERAPTGTEWEFFNAKKAYEQKDEQADKSAPVVLTFRCIREPTISTKNDKEDADLIWQWREVRRFFERFNDDKGAKRWTVIEFDTTDDFGMKLDGQLRRIIKSRTKREHAETGNSPNPTGARFPDEYSHGRREESSLGQPEDPDVQDMLRKQGLESIRLRPESIRLRPDQKLYRIRAISDEGSRSLLLPSEELAEKLKIRRIAGLILSDPTLGIFLPTRLSNKAPTMTKGGLKTQRRTWEWNLADSHFRDYAKDETPLGAAIREFREETGYTAKPTILPRQPVTFLYFGTEPRFPSRWGWVTFFYATVENPRLLELCKPKSDLLSGRWYNPGEYEADRDAIKDMRWWQEVLLLEVGDLELPWRPVT